MIKCIRTNHDNKDFQKLATELDTFLRIHDGDDHAFYSQFNKIDTLNYAIVAYDNELPVGCGAIKEYASDAMEVKRMYVLPNRRGEGIATLILKALEQWCVELSCTKCLLETGIKLQEAIGLYQKNGYKPIPNFGQYENVETSVCLGKELKR